METYKKCGHPIKEVVINTNEYTLATYCEWKSSKPDLCINCWLKKEGINI